MTNHDDNYAASAPPPFGDYTPERLTPEEQEERDRTLEEIRKRITGEILWKTW